MMEGKRLVVVSNRLPITIALAGGTPHLCPSSGGLVSALVPVLRESGGCWVGWAGSEYDEGIPELIETWCATRNYSFEPVFMNSEQRTRFYNGCSNEILWPLFHGHPSRCRFDPAYWRAYRDANEKFADAVRRVAQKQDFIWVQDYHLMLLGTALRKREPRSRIAYFHHIPFPAPDLFETLPWGVELLSAMMQYDSIGFQTPRDVRNFTACLRRLLSHVRVSRTGNTAFARAGGRVAVIGSYPISIDYEEFSAEADCPGVIEAAKAIKQSVFGSSILLGVDRLDYTKGILQRLTAFQTLLESYPELCGRVTLFQIVVPSREDIAEYRRLKLDIEMLISNINGQYSRTGWVPIHYVHRCIPRAELIAFYRAADVALVTPLRDGMNLIAKEFCACRTDDRGVLVLSEFAGAAEELRDAALLVNPNDAERVASVLHRAITMEESEQQHRMKAMRSHIRANDVFHWARSFNMDRLTPADESRMGRNGDETCKFATLHAS